MKRRDFTIVLIAIVVAWTPFFLGVWDKTKPVAGRKARYIDDDVRANNAALETAFDAAHDFTTGSTQTGAHDVNCITSFAIADGTIDACDIAADAVTTAKILNANVTAGKLAADVIDETKIADDGIDSEHYNDGSIDAAHLAADVIDETKIADDGIDSEHYNDGSIDPEHIHSDVRIKGWVRFTGTGTLSVDDSYNVSSVTDNGTGDYTVNWGTDFASTNYAVVISSNEFTERILSQGAGTVQFNTLNNLNNPADASIVCVMAIGDQ